MNGLTFLNKIFQEDPAKKEHIIITIDREHGTDGYAIASIVGAKLNIEVYDEDVIELKTLERKVDFEKIKKDDSFLIGTINDLYRENYSYSQEEISTPDASFLANSKTIRNYAKEGSCIILGKCADYVLRDKFKTFNIFIAADDEYRIQNLMNRYKISREKAISRMNKKDNRRKNHYNKFTNGTWGLAKEYDMTINASKFDKETIANIIIKNINLKIK